VIRLLLIKVVLDLGTWLGVHHAEGRILVYTLFKRLPSSYRGSGMGVTGALWTAVDNLR